MTTWLRWISLAIIAILSVSNPLAAEIIYVDDTATDPIHNGTSWCGGYLYLQDALFVAQAGDTIRVAQGTYKPDQGAGQSPGDRAASFHLISGVGLYGGYAGCGEAEPDARDTIAFETNLSGDLLGNDGSNFANNDENSWHIVSAIGVNEATSLDGFIVSAANANAPDPNFLGGGVYAIESALNVNNCVIKANFATRGAGMYSEGGTPIVTGCFFSDNLADFDFATPPGGGAWHISMGSATAVDTVFRANDGGFGGAVYNAYGDLSFDGCLFAENGAVWGGAIENEFSSQGIFIDCEFDSNTSLSTGAGFRNFASNVTFRGCTFSQNITPNYGGGIYNIGNQIEKTMHVEDCTFISNSAERGAGAYMAPAKAGITVVVNCDFIDNTAADVGGGLLNFESTAYHIEGCRFLGNTALDRGGGMWNSQGASPVVINCLFSGNSANNFGGAMINHIDTHALIVNCTIANNLALGSGGGIYNILGSQPMVLNTILWGNEDSTGQTESAQIHMADSEPVVHHSIIQGWSGLFGGIGNTGASPSFVDEDGLDDTLGTKDDDLRLNVGSPGIDAGTNTVLPDDIFDVDGDGDTVELTPVDLAGRPRVLGHQDSGEFIVDVGAYEGSSDCNENSTDDAIDIAKGVSLDCNGNGIPDECEEDVDCNGNGACDSDDVATGASEDCNDNGIPDECEEDCNANGTPDDCDLAAQVSEDCNGDGRPDECLTPLLDCNDNGVVDECETAAGAAADVNGNGRPDECEPSVLFVQAQANGAANGISWADSFGDLRTAMDVARESVGFVQEIWVALGVFTPDGGSGHRRATFDFPIGVAIYGGFFGNETDREQRNPEKNVTVLSGDLAADDTGDMTSLSRFDNAFHVVTIEDANHSTVLDGFTIA